MFFEETNPHILLPTCEAELKNYVTLRKEYRAITVAPLGACLICSDKEVNGKIGSRRCLCTPHPCEKHICSCAENCCLDCLIKHLWTATNSALRTQGRYRAKCPFCKAEYCHLDLVEFIPNK